MIPARTQYSGDSYHIYEDYNDIHLFVEDKGFENLYKTILERSGITTKKVFSMNGKVSVIKEAQKNKDKKCVYLIDRDWSDALSKNYSQSNLIVLEKYSIENYFIDYSGFKSIVLAKNPKADIDKILSRKEFASIISKLSEILRPLFECYLAMQVAEDPRTGCKQKPGIFRDKKNKGWPDEKKIKNYLKEINLVIPAKVSKYFSGPVLLDKGHGKYMLHFIWNAVRETVPKKEQLDQDSLMMRLAQTVDPNVFSKLCENIIKKSSR